jgi:predicted transcriptional regulator
MDNRSALELAADIVAAHVANNSVAVGDVGNLIQQVHSALAGLRSSPEAAPQDKTPVVSIKGSVRPDYLVCMECGKKQKTLKRHLQTAHGMTPAQYRQDYGLPDTYPLTAANYSEQRKTLAYVHGLGRKPEAVAAEVNPARRTKKLSIKS